MTVYLLKRLIISALTLVLASIVVFAVMEVLPGDPARLMLGLNASADQVEMLRDQMGLNAPLLLRYLHWAGGLLSLDFGRSYTYSVPVIDLVRERIAVSLPLALIALALSTIIAIPVGVFSASRQGRAGDTLAMGAAQLGVAVPNFWFALMLIYLFAVWLRLVPAGGFPGWGAGVWTALKSLILPAVALALPQAAILGRVARSALIEVLNEDYIRTARAKGLPYRAVLWRHALRNAMIPVLTILGLQFAFLLAGTIIIENVFYLPGLGRLIFQAITQRDLIVVESIVMLLVAAVILINLLVDFSYAIVDPRLRGRQ
ncbi:MULTISPECIES: ABC transporter permease [unclassified Mesorhizobium]|uniref:ABC transporter permease n=2 Tax=Mesorhizobium TaxID=68287 RepID=UPI000F76055B|nr:MULTISPECIES: ABC transporter permease [unclassified Mesorhizobium]AZO02107.1 ABC transporter permease [Mesorhizobium sp. M2A.F.Ca.ET.043.02.1.1]RUW72820.1 ABC transporter permease [Mesorhizobium sp. M2A.F.Ca.ET.067.02.1.1]RWC14515.1 MAG: ABC transporter permease [Mesorhizobium sp.]RWE73432.1 MAG: ABC transporter permease [Mesorhizobium sp.]TIU53266.1 MAG: ABC transporter permease subunit [Mesorhizobium sp.]